MSTSIAKIRDTLSNMKTQASAPNPLKPILIGSTKKLLHFLPVQIVIGSILNDVFFQKFRRLGFHSMTLFVVAMAEFARIIASSASASSGASAAQIRNSLFFGPAITEDSLITTYFHASQVMPVIILAGYLTGQAATSLAILYNSSSTEDNIPTINVGTITIRMMMIAFMTLIVMGLHQQSLPDANILVMLINVLIGGVLGQAGVTFISSGQNYGSLMFYDSTNTDTNRVCMVPTVTE